MDKSDVLMASENLANRTGVVIFGTNSDDGYPNMKAMVKMKNNGLKEIWFGTNTSSLKVSQVRKDPKVSVYFLDTEQAEGLMLVGKAEIIDDIDIKKEFWKEGDERYHPKGVEDPENCIMRFIAESGNYYHSLVNTTFELN